MHFWRTNDKPTPAYDRQLHVDNTDTVWEWHARTDGSAWRPTPYRLEKTREYNIYMREFSRSQLPRCPGRLNHEWDSLHARAFVKISWDVANPISGPNPLYLTNVTHAQLISILNTLTPSETGLPLLYGTNATVTVFEVFDLERDAKVLSYNELYSQARGYNCYNRKHGRLVKWAECNDHFRSFPGWWWGDAWTFPGAQILNYLVGGAMVPLDARSNQLFWFHSSSRGLYRQPKVGKMFTGVSTKKVWDNSIADYRLATGVETFQIEPPCIFYTSLGGSLRDVGSLSQLRGTRYWYEQMKGVIIYPLHQGPAAPGGQWALYMKPYGVDTLGIGQQVDAKWKVVVEYVFDTSGGEHEPISRIITPTKGWDDWNQLHRYNFHQAIGIRNVTNESSTCVDNPALPEFIKFYALNIETGLRSKVFSRGLRVVKRKCNVTSNLEPAVFRTP